MKEIHIANTPTQIDGTARCAAAGEEVGVAGGAVGAGEEVGTDTIAADTTLEMEVRPCVNALCLE